MFVLLDLLYNFWLGEWCLLHFAKIWGGCGELWMVIFHPMNADWVLGTLTAGGNTQTLSIKHPLPPACEWATYWNFCYLIFILLRSIVNGKVYIISLIRVADPETRQKRDKKREICMAIFYGHLFLNYFYRSMGAMASLLLFTTPVICRWTNTKHSDRQKIVKRIDVNSNRR